MADKAKYIFGSSSNVEAALRSGEIDACDILFLDGETDPKIGWIDKNGIVRMVANKAQVVRVTELPVDNGDENTVYIYNNECYIWDGTQCISMSQSADLTVLETQVSDLEKQMASKVDESTIDAKVEAAVESAVEEAISNEVVVEF